MRCPKCQYISFDDGPRCRNCGYEFSLSVEDPPLDVAIARDQPGPGRGRDTADALDAPVLRRRHAAPGPAADLDAFTGDDRLPSASDLPLFTSRVPDDQAPLVTPPAVPRAPLAVRRAAPGPRGRARLSSQDEPRLGLSDEAHARRSAAEAPRSTVPAVAGVGRRLAAGAIDAAILGGIAGGVVYLTLRLLDLTWADWRILPLPPLVAFLLLVIGGYLVLFTAAGGQTIGKMIARIRVVVDEPDAARAAQVPFGTAALRAALSLGSFAALGAGFLPVLLHADRRAFHDRLAATRVVPA